MTSKAAFERFWSPNPLNPLLCFPTLQLLDLSSDEGHVNPQSLILFGALAGMCFCECQTCLCLHGRRCRPIPALVRLWSLAFPCTASLCGVACLLPVCVRGCLAWFIGPWHTTLWTHLCSWNGYSMCWWWWIHLGGSPLMGVRCGPTHEKLQKLSGTCPADSMEHKLFLNPKTLLKSTLKSFYTSERKKHVRTAHSTCLTKYLYTLDL